MDSPDISKYADIINLPHPTSKRHPRMSAINRAAQFSPFAALTGYDAAIRESSRLTGKRRILCDEEKAQISEKLQLLSESEDKNSITVLHFVMDALKDGGTYCETVGEFYRVDKDRGEVVLSDGTRIPIESIDGISGLVFDKYGIVW